ncbi:MAG: carbon storage regulator CsrA [Deferribacteraceae bacterium]|jgi:carbon storage regulator|nr:carbon storage regulator CsrA [Deferribacteraceae bacterium]
MLILSRKMNESIMVGEHIEIKIIDVNNRVVKLGIDAPKDVSVHRKEIFEAIKDENLAAPMADKQKIVSLFEFYNQTKTDK